MKKAALLLLVLSSTAFADPVVTSWVNPDCATGSCEVKGMRLFIEKFNSAADKIAGNSMAVEIETTSKEDLKKYAVVQYIKGCVFETSNIGGGTRIGTREFFGKKGQPFLHRSWEIDSASDQDPIYWSNANAGFDEIRGFEIPRNSPYHNDNPLLNEGSRNWAGKLSNLKSNRIYSSDFPTPGVWSETNGLITARISSLQFKVCLHKIDAVPATVADPKTEIPEALTCMEWSSNYQFDFKKKVFVERASIHSACN